MKTIHYDYASLTKEDLIRHCEAYAEGMHELADKCMVLQGRLRLIERDLAMFDNVEVA